MRKRLYEVGTGHLANLHHQGRTLKLDLTKMDPGDHANTMLPIHFKHIHSTADRKRCTQSQIFPWLRPGNLKTIHKTHLSADT